MLQVRRPTQKSALRKLHTAFYLSPPAMLSHSARRSQVWYKEIDTHGNSQDSGFVWHRKKPFETKLHAFSEKVKNVYAQLISTRVPQISRICTHGDAMKNCWMFEPQKPIFFEYLSKFSERSRDSFFSIGMSTPSCWHVNIGCESRFVAEASRRYTANFAHSLIHRGSPLIPNTVPFRRNGHRCNKTLQKNIQ